MPALCPVHMLFSPPTSTWFNSVLCRVSGHAAKGSWGLLSRRWCGGWLWGHSMLRQFRYSDGPQGSTATGATRYAGWAAESTGGRLLMAGRSFRLLNHIDNSWELPGPRVFCQLVTGICQGSWTFAHELCLGPSQEIPWPAAEPIR
jgi:hypothetical protein